MTNELTPLEDDADLTDDITAEDDVADAQEDTPEPDELETLRAEVEALKQNQAAVEDLKRSVGRIQSLAAKFETASTDSQRAEIQAQIDQKFAAISDQLAEVVSGLDETSIDPTTRQRILAAQAQARQAAEVQKLVAQEMQKQAPKSAPQTSNVSPLEAELVNTITAAGLDPDGGLFDWTAMSKMVIADPSGNSLRKHVLDKILEAKTEESAAARRSAAKKQAGNGAPKPNSAPRDPAARMGQAMDNGDFATAYKELLKLRSS